MIVSDWRIEDGLFNWSVTVPANTTATVYVPATTVEVVTESGQPATKTAGASFIRMDDDAAVFTVASGRYSFEVKR
jgi:alpha-L-rhamnosidase